MTEAPRGGEDSRLDKDLLARSRPEEAGPDGSDTYALYRRGLDLLGRGSAAAAAQLLERAAAAEPRSPSVREALARAQFDARRYAGRGGQLPADRGSNPQRRLRAVRPGPCPGQAGNPGRPARRAPSPWPPRCGRTCGITPMRSGRYALPSAPAARDRPRDP